MSLVIPSVSCVFLSNIITLNNRSINQVIINTTKYYNYSNFSISSSRFSCKKTLQPPWRIIYFGTDDFSLACLRPLHAKMNTGTLISSLGVVSETCSQVHKFAASEQLPIHEWPPDVNTLKNYDIGIVVSYGKLIPEYIINGLPLGIMNIHGSLLPRWRGAAPITYAIMNGDVETGVTIMRIKARKFDVGDIVKQYRCCISPTETTPELSSRLALHAGHLLMDCVRDLPRCLDVATPQPKDGVTHAPKLVGKLSKVDWKTMSAQRVYNLHRAISHMDALTTNWFGKPVKLYNITLDKEYQPTRKIIKNTASESESLSPSYKRALDILNSSDQISNLGSIKDVNSNTLDYVFPGKVMFNKLSKVLTIECADGKSIQCSNFKVAGGRNVMTTADFYNGYLSKIDKKDWHFE